MQISLYGGLRSRAKMTGRTLRDLYSQPATRARSESIEGDNLLVMIIKSQPSVNRQEATMSNVIGMRKTFCDCHSFQWKFCALQHHVHRLRSCNGCGVGKLTSFQVLW